MGLVRSQVLGVLQGLVKCTMFRKAEQVEPQATQNEQLYQSYPLGEPV
jgi:hypothetical protein